MSTDCAKSLQSCLILCDPMDCSLPGSSVLGILQARILEWVAFPSPGDLPDPGLLHFRQTVYCLKVGNCCFRICPIRCSKHALTIPTIMIFILTSKWWRWMKPSLPLVGPKREASVTERHFSCPCLQVTVDWWFYTKKSASIFSQRPWITHSHSGLMKYEHAK